MPTAAGVAQALDAAIYRATIRPAYAAGFIVGNAAGWLLLRALGRRLSR